MTLLRFRCRAGPRPVILAQGAGSLARKASRAAWASGLVRASAIMRARQFGAADEAQGLGRPPAGSCTGPGLRGPPLSRDCDGGLHQDVQLLRRPASRSTRPMRWASAPSIDIGRSGNSVRAAAWPMRSMTSGEITPGTRPSRTSVKAKRASKAGHHDVAGGHQAHAAAEGRPLHPGHHRGRDSCARPGTWRPSPGRPPGFPGSRPAPSCFISPRWAPAQNTSPVARSTTTWGRKRPPGRYPGSVRRRALPGPRQGIPVGHGLEQIAQLVDGLPGRRRFSPRGCRWSPRARARRFPADRHRYSPTSGRRRI